MGDASEFPRYLRVERRSETFELDGQPIEAWALHAMIWASHPKPSGSGSLVVVSDEPQSRTRIQYDLRKETGEMISPDTDRIIDGTLTLGVVDVVPVDARKSRLTVEAIS